MPSVSIEVRRISPAPRSSPSRAHSAARRPVSTPPACERTSPPVASIGEHDRLRAEPLGERGQELGPRQRRRVDRDLVRAGLEQRLGVGDRADAAADRERDRQPLGHPADEADERLAPLDRRGDVEEDELVRAGVRVRLAELDRVADVAQPLEAHALDDAAAGDVQAGDQAGERHRSRKRAPARPLFSGWNCTPRKLPDSAAATTPSEVAVAAGVSAANECAK